MKLAKLSLAAIVAVSTMTTFASATPLEEALEGVELNGFIRYRFYDEDGALDHKRDRQRFSAPFHFTIPVADNLKSGFTVRYEDSDYARNEGLENGDKAWDVTKMWFQYGVDGFSLKAGKFEIVTPWTDPGYGGVRGNGALAMYTGVPGWTFAAAGFVNTNVGEFLQETAVPVAITDAYAEDISGENLYALAAIGAIGPVDVQLWGSRLTNVFDYAVFAQAAFEMAGFNIRAQINNLKLADETENLFKDDDGIYWGVEAGYNIAGFGINAGYTQNDDEQPIYALSIDTGEFIEYGEQLDDVTKNWLDAEVYFGEISYKIASYKLMAGYGEAEADDDIGNEWYIKGQYKYSKNFKLTAYYSDLDMDTDDADDNEEIRFEAKYSF